MASKKQQRRSLGQASPLVFVKSSRAGIENQRHKKVTKQQLIQANLWETYLEDTRGKDSPFQELGLDLSIPEDKALLAILILLEETEHKGNGDPIRLTPTDFGISYEVLLPVLDITFPQYLEAFGLRKNKKGQYNRRQRDEAIKALYALASSRKLLIYNEKTKRASLIRKSILEVQTNFENVEAGELQEIYSDDTSKRASGLRVSCGFLLIWNIEKKYVLKPVSMYTELDDYHGGKRYSPAIPHLINFLLYYDKPDANFSISPENLARKLGLGSYIEQRKLGKALEIVEEALQVAKDLGYLLDYWRNEAGNIQWKRNPERCRILGPIEKRKLKQEAARLEG